MKTGSHHFSRNGFLTDRGYAEVAQQISLEGLDSRVDIEYLDKSGSVSAMVEVEDHWVDELLDQQYRRFQHGS